MKVKQTVLPDGMGVRCERGIKSDKGFFGLNNWKNGAVINWLKKDKRVYLRVHPREG